MRLHALPRFRFPFVLLLAGAGVGCATVPEDPQTPSVPVDALIPEMERVFETTRGMIDHTNTVLAYATDIQRHEGGNRSVVRAAAMLHDIGIPKALEVHGSSAGRYQEQEGPPIAREILTRHRFPLDLVDHISGIVANHHSDLDPAIVTTIEFKILWDADWLVNFPGRHRGASDGEKAAAIEEIFKTARGKEIARKLFLD